MGQLVLLVVAAAWAAVLIPPLLRSRVENRPNSSVTDFRRQLNRLQSTVPARANSGLRPVGRQLAPSPLHRPVAGGRPGDRRARASVHRSVPARRSSTIDDTGGHGRSHRHVNAARSTATDLRRRRSNILFMLVVVASSTLFLAATTKATVMLYAFALAFLAVCGYVYLLSQMRQREQRSWPAGR